jgi:large subunit ribosomal protein L6
MSRIGKIPISISEDVEVKIEDDIIVIKSQKGQLSQKIHPHVKVEKKENQILVSVNNPNDRDDRSLWGLFRTLIFNMIEGLTRGFEKKLEIKGVGFKASVSGKKLILNVGFSHPVEFSIPDGISIKVDKGIITVSGVDKQLVGETAANIRALKKPEPYKGKGIKYIDEVVRRKAGKVVKAAGSEGGGK